MVKQKFSKEGETGFRAEYFNNTDLSGNPVLVRIDKDINFNWFNGSPDKSINSDNFSVCWTAKLVVPVTKTYMFKIQVNLKEMK